MGRLLYLWRRLREPSTHAALTAMATYFGITHADFSQIESWLVIAFGALGVFVEEKGPATKVDGF